MRQPSRLAILFLLLSASLAGIAEFLQHRTNARPDAVVQSAQEKLMSLGQQMSASLEKVAAFKSDEEFHSYFLHSGLEKSGFSFYVADKGQIIYWSDNEPVVDLSSFNNLHNGELVSLPNGDFVFYEKRAGERQFFGLILLKHNYDYENKYLVNEFNPALGLNSAFHPDTSGHLSFSAPDQKSTLKLSYDYSTGESELSGKWLYLFALIFAFIGIYVLSNFFLAKSFSKGMVFLVFIWGVRTLTILFKFPEELYRLELFSPRLYASSFYFNSLGDFLINVAFFLIVAFSIYRNIKTEKSPASGKFWFYPILALLALSTHLLMTSLIVNSQISFDVSKPLELDGFSIWAFMAIAILLITFLISLAAALRFSFNYRVNSIHIWFAVFFCAVYSSGSLYRLNNQKEIESRKLLAQKVEVRQDHVAEYLLEEARKKIIDDAEIASLSANVDLNHDKISSILSQRYFSGYLARFESSVYIFYPDSSGNGKSLADFQSLASQGKPTFSDGLYFLNNENGRSSYIAFYTLQKAKAVPTTMVVLLSARFLQSAEGFPELFLSGQNNENLSSGDYSIARYSNQSLIYEFGNYTYALTDKDFRDAKSEFSQLSLNGYNHLIYHLSPTSIIVVSHPEQTLFSLLTLFSWMLALCGLLTLLIFILSVLFASDSTYTWNLTRRIQISVVSVVVLSFVLVGAGTVYYIDKKYEADQRKSISDQVNALWFTVSENALPYLDNDSSRVLESILTRFVNNTNIDFNVFNENGELIFSSQPKIYNENIISSRMNPEAFFEIREKGLTQYIHPENAGKLKYVSGYAPITNANGEIKAYLGLPYFEKQNELNKEVSGFLSALLNIYVFLLAVAVLLTVIISSRITQPLLLIQERMAGLRLGTTNEQIQYSRKDEIGELVKEYNRMIDELALSASKLAQSERETAWREMARQVAHEIKNPLTPMKLSVQHLQRTLIDKGGNDKEFVDRISGTLIQQIDTLANIATAFSDFARMPQSVPVRIQPAEVLKPLVDLYREIPTLEVSFEEKNSDLFVLADKDQLNRIFSNILRNAMQAIPDNKAGRIAVTISRHANSIRIEIADNGIGIPEDQREKIFKPNFTTKSSGMGLGLAMVYNLVDQAGGKVWFTSTYNSGTSFFIDLPLA